MHDTNIHSSTHPYFWTTCSSISSVSFTFRPSSLSSSASLYIVV